MADDLFFPNGSVITPDGATLIVGESFGGCLTAFDVGADGSLTNRREWARVAGAIPDGICLDADGAVWMASPISGQVIRVAEGGEVLEEVRTSDERQPFACMLGGADGRTLFVCTALESEPEACRRHLAGRIEAVGVDVPGAGLALTPRRRATPGNVGSGMAPHIEDHLHAHRRGARAGDPLVAARHQGLHGRSRREVETRDISLAGRILAAFPERLGDAQRVPDALAELGALTQEPEANIIKLPNIRASIPQIKAAVAGAPGAGLRRARLPRGARHRRGPRDQGPLRQGQGQCGEPRAAGGQLRPAAPAAVKAYARKNPHSMGAWSPTRRPTSPRWPAATSSSTETSVTVADADDVRIEHVGVDGRVTVLKASTPLQAGEIIDAAVMRAPR